MSAYLGLGVVTATGGYPVKRNKSHSIDSWVFDAVSPIFSFPVTTLSDGVGRTTIEATVYVPQAFKIAKVGVYCTAIDAVTGDSFNILVGAGTPNASGILGNTGPYDNQRNIGYPTAFAAAGNLVFGTDLAFTVANFPNLATGTGGYNQFEPTTYSGAPNYDVCYLPGPYSLIATTNASTGAITDLTVSVIGCFIDTNCARNLDGQPTVDW